MRGGRSWRRDCARSGMTATATRQAVRFEAPGADDGIGRIVLDRPDDEVNAINLDFIEALRESVHAARSAANLRGVIVVSAKPRQWVAGADLNMVTQAPDGSGGAQNASHAPGGSGAEKASR